MSYVALARRYRPQLFSEVVGQPQVTETLRQAIAAGRVAAAYLFTGPRGSGKTTVARILAKAVNCDTPQGGEPCGRCEPCVSIADSRSLDVLEIDGASNNSVEDVRELRENVGYAATRPGKRKVYIVDEVHMLSQGAFNALLKTLEEPPAHVMFVFATTAPRKVPATIVSRCQRFDFRRLQTDEIRERLAHIIGQEKLAVEDGAIFLLAKRADGSLRDALSLLDQVVSSATGRIGPAQVTSILGLVPVEAYFEITRAVLERDAKAALAALHGVLAQGADAGDFVLGLVEHLRNLLLLSIDGKLRAEVQLGDAHLKDAQDLAARFRTEDLLYLLNRAAALHEDTLRTSQPVVGLEAAVVEMTHFESRVVLTELLDRLEGDPGGGSRTPLPAGGSTRGAPAPPASGASTVRRGAPSRPRSEGDADEQVQSRAPRARLEEPGQAPQGPARMQVVELSAAPARPEAAMPAAVAMPGGPAVPAAPGAPAASEPARIAAELAAGGPPPEPRLRPAAREADAGPMARAAGHSVATATLDLDQVCRRWSEFTIELRATKAFLSVCLGEGKPVRLAGSVLEVWFPPEHTFHQHAVQDAIRQRELDPYLEVFFGQRLKLAIALEETPSQAPGPAARLTPDDIARSRRGAIEDVVQNTPAIEDIIQAFDGEVLEDHDG